MHMLITRSTPQACSSSGLRCRPRSCNQMFSHEPYAFSWCHATVASKSMTIHVMSSRPQMPGIALRAVRLGHRARSSNRGLGCHPCSCSPCLLTVPCHSLINTDDTLHHVTRLQTPQKLLGSAFEPAPPPEGSGATLAAAAACFLVVPRQSCITTDSNACNVTLLQAPQCMPLGSRACSSTRALRCRPRSCNEIFSHVTVA